MKRENTNIWRKNKLYLQKGAIGHNPIPENGILKARVGDKIRIISEEK